MTTEKPAAFDPSVLRQQFPLLSQKMNGKPLAYLDNASTTQKPQRVIDALSSYYGGMNANIHRGVYTLSEEATEAYEQVRREVAEFLGEGGWSVSAEEIVFTSGTTDAVNLVAATWGEQNIGEGDEVVVTPLEHHSNLVPWQELCRRKGAVLKYLELLPNGTVDVNKLDELFGGGRVKLAAVSMMSNVLGTVLPLEQILYSAKRAGVVVLVDGAQGVAHMGRTERSGVRFGSGVGAQSNGTRQGERGNVNAKESRIGPDFLTFSSHKMCGPTGVGVLYGRRELLEAMPPYRFGGDMVKEVGGQRATWNDVPYKFEAGTPNIAGVIAFGEALRFLREIGFENILEHSKSLAAYAGSALKKLPFVEVYGPSKEDSGKKNSGELGKTGGTKSVIDVVNESIGIVSFNVKGVHPHDVGSILSNEGVAIRTGHHCAQPLMEWLGVPATARMSFYLYNTEEEVARAVEALQKVAEIFKI